MSSYKSSKFAVVGAGLLGSAIVAALMEQNLDVVIFARPDSADKKTLPAGVKLVKVDFTDVAALAAALQENKIDVVLSTLTTLAAAAQKPIVDAAKVVGVKLFVPSEYGMPTDGQTVGPLGDKNKIAADLKAAGIPSLRVFTGMFTEFIPWLYGYGNDKKITIVGSADVKTSFSALPDIAGFVAHVLSTVPASQLENKILRIEGDRKTAAEVAALFGTTVVQVERIQGENGELKTGLLGLVASGNGSTGFDAVNKVERTGSDAAGSANALWPGHQWKTIKDVHNL